MIRSNNPPKPNDPPDSGEPIDPNDPDDPFGDLIGPIDPAEFPDLGDPANPAEPQEAKLPFPTRPLRCGDVVVEEYVIPDDKRQEVLEQLYIFDGIPSLDQQLFDLHEGKLFIVREYRVIWDRGHNWLVSPYYPSSGGTVIDWLPPEAAEDDGDDEPGGEPGDEGGLDGLFGDDEDQ